MMTLARQVEFAAPVSTWRTALLGDAIGVPQASATRARLSQGPYGLAGDRPCSGLDRPVHPHPRNRRGSVGQRLQADRFTTVSDEFLRDVAKQTLGALRCSQGYLNALRIVLGNQAHSELHGYLLEMNTRTTFASDKVMRTILRQMEEAGITFRKQVSLGHGRVQVMHCYRRRTPAMDPAATLDAMYRQSERECRAPSAPRPFAADELPY